MKKILILTGVIGLSTILSCENTDLEKVNPNGVTFETYFTNDNELIAGVNAAYSTLQGFGLGAREWFFTHDLRSDEMASGGGESREALLDATPLGRPGAGSAGDELARFQQQADPWKGPRRTGWFGPVRGSGGEVRVLPVARCGRDDDPVDA